MSNIGNVQLHGRVVLGPMAGVTDFAFRALCRAQGAALTTTEMISAKALVYKDEKTKSLLYLPEDEPDITDRVNAPWGLGPTYLNIGDCLE